MFHVLDISNQYLQLKEYDSVMIYIPVVCLQ